MNGVEGEVLSQRSFSSVTAFVVALETYRVPLNGDPLPSVAYAHADGDAIAQTLRDIYADLPSGAMNVHVLKGADASLTALRDELSHIIKNLDADELFVFYYAGHGFHGAGGNRLCAFDTNPAMIEQTTVLMRDDLLEPLAHSACRHGLIFIEASAEQIREAVNSCADVSNLGAAEISTSLNSDWYCGTFLSCAPGENTYASASHKHGVWTHFLTEALTGRASEALTKDRWVTDVGLRDFLRREVPRYILREMKVRGHQTPQAILSSRNSFQINQVPAPATTSGDTALAGIVLQNNSEFLEGTETGAIKRLPGFQRGFGKAPTNASSSVNSWCQRLLAERVTAELQDLYQTSRKALNARRKDVQKAEDTGVGDLDTAAFRYSIETGQYPDDPAEFFIRRRLELRQDWDVHRAAIDEIFGSEFDCLVVEFERMDDTFDDLVERLEDIQDIHGGEVIDEDQTQCATLIRDGVTYTFDLIKRRLEISFGRTEALKLIDAARDIQLGTNRASPLLGS